MDPNYDRESVTAAHGGYLGFWVRCPSVRHELSGPLCFYWCKVFAWRAQFAAGDLVSTEAPRPRAPKYRLSAVCVLCVRHDFVCGIVVPASGLVVYHRIQRRLHYWYVHDFCADLRFDAGYGDGLNHMVRLFDRCPGAVSPWGRRSVPNGLRRLVAVGRRFDLGSAHLGHRSLHQTCAGLAVGLRAVCDLRCAGHFGFRHPW